MLVNIFEQPMDIEFVGGGRFQILRSIGSGNFGQTYLAKDLQQFNTLCVVKRLQPSFSNPEYLEIAKILFEKEAKILHKLGRKHDRIPYLLAYFQENKDFYLVQEFIAGHDLAKELVPGQQLDPAAVLALLKDILEPLAFLHHNKVIHRDIKPSNLMRRDRDGKIVLIDFGAIKQIATTELRPNSSIGTIIGTPGYMPDEQSEGLAKYASDIYAVGLVAIQALSGVFPLDFSIDDRTKELIWQQEIDFLPDSLRQVLEKMVRYNFKQRYSTAAQALQAVLAIASDFSSSSLGDLTETVNKKKLSDLREFSENLSYDISSTIIDAADNKNIIESFKDNNFLEENLAKTEQIPKPKLKTFNFEVITVDRFGKEIKKTSSRAEYYTEDLGDGIGLDMVYICGGTATSESCRTSERSFEDPEEKYHQVKIKPFFMSKFLVTQAQWRSIATKTAIVERKLNEDPAYFKGDNLPVETVCWYEAKEFCQRLSQKSGLNYRLPTVAEWEYACLANGKGPFSYGETIASELANYDARYTYGDEPAGKYRGKTVPVGSFPPNAFGLYDLHGQVWEWCCDRHWQEGDEEIVSVLKGGSWNHGPEDCRYDFRYYLGEPRLIGKFIGFRVICHNYGL